MNFLEGPFLAMNCDGKSNTSRQGIMLHQTTVKSSIDRHSLLSGDEIFELISGRAISRLGLYPDS
jgi:hypothetical protein